MTLQEQVCSLELAKKLKELGVKQESQFVWIHRILDRTETNENDTIIMWRDVLSEWFPDDEVTCSAFTVAELGEMLPKDVSFEGADGDMHSSFLSCDWITNEATVRYEDAGWGTRHNEKANTEADARAKMLIYLLENKIINPNQYV